MAPRATRPKMVRAADVRKGDEVLVLSGREAGKRGVVDRLVRPGRVVIEGLNIAKRHTKPRQSQGRTDRQPTIQQGGILEIAQPIDLSNVMVVCPHCQKPTRVRHQAASDGRSIRVCRHCGETLTRVVQS